MHTQRRDGLAGTTAAITNTTGRRYAPARLVSGVLPVVWCCACAVQTHAQQMTLNWLDSFVLRIHGYTLTALILQRRLTPSHDKQRPCKASDTFAHTPGSRRSRAWRGGLRTQLLVSGLNQTSTQYMSENVMDHGAARMGRMAWGNGMEAGGMAPFLISFSFSSSRLPLEKPSGSKMPAARYKLLDLGCRVNMRDM